VGLADSWGARVPSGRGGVGWLLCRRWGRRVGATKRFQTCQWAAIFFFLDLCTLGQGAHVPGELRVDERDRIIAIAAIDAEVAHVGGDHFGFRGSKRGKVLHFVLSRENDEVQKLTVSARLKNGR